jgi:hypothetical protein
VFSGTIIPALPLERQFQHESKFIGLASPQLRHFQVSVGWAVAVSITGSTAAVLTRYRMIKYQMNPKPHRKKATTPNTTNGLNATSLTFATLTPGPDGRLRWSLQGQAGTQVVLQSSTDLKAWTPLSTNRLPAEVDVNPATGGDLLLLRAVQEN